MPGQKLSFTKLKEKQAESSNNSFSCFDDDRELVEFHTNVRHCRKESMQPDFKTKVKELSELKTPVKNYVSL